MIFRLVEDPLDFLTLENFDHIVSADIIVIFKGHTAFLTGLHLGNFVLEALKGFKRAFMDHHIIAQKPHTGAAPRNAFGDQTAGHFTNARDLEDFFDLGVSDKGFANFRT